ncbi:MAG: hypothetical protein V1701_11690 [Planctomycetota bacterium]
MSPPRKFSKTIDFEASAQEIYSRFKSFVYSLDTVPDDVKGRIMWDDQARNANINYLGLKAAIQITGDKPCALKIDVSADMPLSLLFTDARIAEALDLLKLRL